MAVLRAHLDDTLAGCGRLVLLVGEPGMGKTRLAQEVATQAQRRGARVYAGHGYDGEGAPPFWPWVQIVRAYLATCDLPTLRTDLGSGAAAIAQVIPDVRERLPELPAAPALGSAQARFHFFDCFTTFLINVAHAQPLVLLLDDLHWADASSLLFLQFLVRELSAAPVLVIAAYRDSPGDLHHPLRQTLGELARVPGSQTIALQGFTEPEVARVLHHSLGRVPDAALLTAVYQYTEGHPFFLTEIVPILARAEPSSQCPAPSTVHALPLPQRVAEMIRRRLAGLSPACLRVLTLAAVIGRDFPLVVLTRASGVPASQMLPGLEEACGARLITEAPQTTGGYRFAHELIRETLYSALPLTQRVAYHRQVGEAFERLAGADPTSYLMDLAYHFAVAAQQEAAVPKAIAYAIQAGAHAMRRFAYEEAITQYQRALHLLALQEVDDGQRGELLLSLGEAQAKAGNTLQARETFHHAATLARRQQQHTQLARAVLGLTERVVTMERSCIALLDEALDALGDRPSPLRAQVLSRLAAVLAVTETHDRCLAVSQHALELARHLGDASTLAVALHARHWALWGQPTVHERLAVATEMIQVADAAGAQELALTGRAWRIANLLHVNDLAAADAEFAVYAHRVATLRQPGYQWRVLLFRAMRAFLVGQFAEGEALAYQAAALGQQVQPQVAKEICGIQLFFVRQEQQRLHELAPLVEGMAAQHPRALGLRSALALLYWELGREADARRVFATLIAHQVPPLPRNAIWLDGVSLLAVVCAALRDAHHARLLYALLSPYAGQSLVLGQGGAMLHLGAITRYLGLLAATMGRWEDAEAHFVEALATNAQLGARPWVAYTQYEYAQMLLVQQGAGAHAKARALLSSAWATARELAMLCSGQGKTDTELSGLEHSLVGIGTDIAQIRVQPRAVVKHFDIVDHIIPRFLPGGLPAMRGPFPF